MTTIFVSYSSARSAEAELVKAALASAKYEGIFVAHEDIEVGQNWREQLMHRLRAARAIVLLWSKESADSKWCHSEIAIGRFQNKPILPIRLDGTPLGVLADLQAIDLGPDNEGVASLCRELERLGLGSASSFSFVGGNPYPGFQAFEKDHAAVFFGRQEESQDVMSRLARSRSTGARRMTLIAGPSGAGKSSLLRAGVIPRLEKNPVQWRVVGPIRPGLDTRKEIARAFAAEFEKLRQAKSVDDLVAALGSHSTTIDMARDLCAAAQTPEASVVLCIDQLEDVFQTSPRNVITTLDLLAALDGGPSPAVVVAATIRTDALAKLHAGPGFDERPPTPFTLGLMPRARFQELIVRPAEHVGVLLEPELVTRLVEDARTPEALPLVAMALWAMFEARGNSTTLRLVPDYTAIGGVSGVVASRAASIIRDAKATEVAALREAFLKMATIGEDGSFIRRRAAWAEIPTQAHRLVNELSTQRLLMQDGDADRRTVEVTHESLFEVWPELKAWLTDQRDFLIWEKGLHDFRRVVDR